MTLLQTVTTQGGSIDTTTVTIIVTALVSAITGLAGLLYRRLLQENSELRTENVRLRTALSGYEQAAPNLVAVIERWMHSLDDDSDDGSTRSDGPLSPPLPRRSRPPRKRPRS